MSTEYEIKRQEYLSGKLCHRKFYLWVAEYIGLNETYFPSAVKILVKNYKNALVNITDLKSIIEQLPLADWDKQDFNIRNLAFAKGTKTWSASNTVCVLKVMVEAYLENLK